MNLKQIWEGSPSRRGGWEGLGGLGSGGAQRPPTDRKLYSNLSKSNLSKSTGYRPSISNDHKVPLDTIALSRAIISVVNEFPLRDISQSSNVIPDSTEDHSSNPSTSIKSKPMTSTPTKTSRTLSRQHLDSIFPNSIASNSRLVCGGLLKYDIPPDPTVIIPIR